MFKQIWADMNRKTKKKVTECRAELNIIKKHKCCAKRHTDLSGMFMSDILQGKFFPMRIVFCIFSNSSGFFYGRWHNAHSYDVIPEHDLRRLDVDNIWWRRSSRMSLGRPFYIKPSYGSTKLKLIHSIFFTKSMQAPRIWCSHINYVCK